MLDRLATALLTLETATCRRRKEDPELRGAMAVLRGAVLDGTLREVAGDAVPAADLVAAWLAAGGDWRDLVAAVNAAALDASTRRTPS
jgi:hypothetical protein